MRRARTQLADNKCILARSSVVLLGGEKKNNLSRGDIPWKHLAKFVSGCLRDGGRCREKKRMCSSGAVALRLGSLPEVACARVGSARNR